MRVSDLKNTTATAEDIATGVEFHPKHIDTDNLSSFNGMFKAMFDVATKIPSTTEDLKPEPAKPKVTWPSATETFIEPLKEKVFVSKREEVINGLNGKSIDRIIFNDQEFKPVISEDHQMWPEVYKRFNDKLKTILATFDKMTNIITVQNKKIEELTKEHEELFDRVVGIDHRLTKQEFEGVTDDDIKEVTETLTKKIKDYVDMKDEEVKTYACACADTGVHNARNCGESNSMEKQGEILVKREDGEEQD